MGRVVLVVGVFLVVTVGGGGLLQPAVAGTRARTTLSFQDPRHLCSVHVTLRDVKRAGVKAVPTLDSSKLALHIPFTRRGRNKYHALYVCLAKRSARAHFPQSLTFSVDGHVYVRDSVIYGMPARFTRPATVEFHGLGPAITARLAREIRSGHSP